MPGQIEKAMDLLPPALTSNPNFAHLVRIIDDINLHSHKNCSHRHIAFRPDFDLIESDDAFELYGELPGVKKEDVTVELTDARTMVVKGSVRHSYSKVIAIPTATATEGSTEQTENATDLAATQEPQTQPAEGEQVSAQETKPAKPAHPTYIISERGSGSFQRSFKLPIDVDRQGIEATFKEGVLHVRIPKLVKSTGDVQKVEIS